MTLELVAVCNDPCASTAAPGWCCRCRRCSAARETHLATEYASDQGSGEVIGVLQKQDGNEVSQLTMIDYVANPIFTSYIQHDLSGPKYLQMHYIHYQAIVYAGYSILRGWVLL